MLSLIECKQDLQHLSDLSLHDSFDAIDAYDQATIARSIANCSRMAFQRKTTTSSTPGSPPPSGRIRRSAGRSRRRSSKHFYPTSTLITSRDIITLWVARMVLTGLYNMGEVPFHEVYIHPKILDGYGETMSKSKGNGVDPLDVIEKFGADALRFGLAYLTTETQDVRMPVEFECPHCQALIRADEEEPHSCRGSSATSAAKPFGTQWAEKPEDKALPRGAVVSERFELGRNFCNKLWNASRFALMNLRRLSAPGGGRPTTEICCSKTAGSSRAWRPSPTK